MNILILSGSPRKNGNTDLLVEAFAKGASEKNHVEVVSVHDYTVHPCMGCNACFSSEGNACVQKDDMPELSSTASSPNTNSVSTFSISKTRVTCSCAARRRRVAFGARKRWRKRRRWGGR